MTLLAMTTARSNSNSPVHEDEWTTVGASHQQQPRKKSLAGLVDRFPAAAAAAPVHAQGKVHRVHSARDLASSPSLAKRALGSASGSANSSRRGSNSSLHAEPIASLQKGSTGAKAQAASDWRRTGDISPSASTTGASPKKQPLRLPRVPHAQQRSVSPPLQAHAVQHQVGHSHFSLGPTDFPNVTFRRAAWAQEKARARALQSASQPPTPGVLSPEPIVVVEPVAELPAVEAEVATINIAEDVVPVQVAESQKSTPLASEAVEIIVAPDSAPVEAETPADVVVEVVAAPLVEAIISDVIKPTPVKKTSSIKKTLVIAPVVEPVVAPATLELPLVKSEARHLPSSTAFHIVAGLVGLLLVLGVTCPSTATVTLPLAAFLTTGLLAIHSTAVQAKVPAPLLRLLGITPLDEQEKSESTAEHASPSQQKSKHTHKKKHASHKGRGNARK